MNEDPWVNASDVGQAKFCAHSLYLQKRGYKPNREASSMMRRGSQVHERRATDALLAEDTRCYIASALFGVEHPVTEALRQWRDTQLSPYRWGRIVIACYYKVSPWLVTHFGHTAIFQRVVRRVIYRITGVLERD